MKKHLFILSLFSILILSSTQLSADVVRVEVGAGFWNQDVSGKLNSNGSTVDLENNLGFDDELKNYIYADIKHPVPILPNLRIEHTQIGFDGTASSSFTFENQAYSGVTNSVLNIDQTDVIAYYNLWDTAGLNFDLGLDFKVIDANVTVKDNLGHNESVKATGVIPMLYSNLRYDILLTDLGIELEGKAFKYSDSNLYDMSAKIDYNVFAGITAEVGYRIIDFDIGEKTANDFDTDLTLSTKVSGLFFGLSYKF